MREEVNIRYPVFSITLTTRVITQEGFVGRDACATLGWGGHGNHSLMSLLMISTAFLNRS
jgi:hypothetical protein